IFSKCSNPRKDQYLDAVAAGIGPFFKEMASESGPVVVHEGKPVIMLGSNNYLGLTSDERVKRAATEAVERYGSGVTGSRLMNGTLPLHRELEDALLAVDAIYSMEGDIAPLRQIADVCDEHGARLLVDEAHALGVMGPKGAGLSAETSIQPDLLMGTFSKSLASCGGFLIGPASVLDWFRIACRPFLFTASGVPAALGAALSAVQIAGEEAWRRAEVLAR